MSAALFGGVAAPASAARVIKANPARSWGVTYLGSWHVTAHPEFGKAVHALGSPSNVANPDIPGCRATWSGLGLRIQFESFGGGVSCSDGLAQAAIVKGAAGRSSWRTQRGLRVGDSLRKLRRLYPNARRRPSARVIVYQRNPALGDGSIVTAVIREHRVASFRLWLGGAGD
ncbi:MAG: hypothetical protein QOE60_1885 [Thermoleophilaceae bacterium]|nr:hypothetical protein [Thermoleophilaceae bacterium]